MTAKEIIAARNMLWQVPKDIILGPGSAALTPPLHMAQNLEEITSLVDVILGYPESERKLALEIGLLNGGTHLLWRTLYERVIGIELNAQAVMHFACGLVKPENSTMIAANSTFPSTAKIVANLLAGRKLDLLFIDGDHKYYSVEADFLNYYPFVRQGGLVVFHDTIHDANDVGRFVKELKEQRHPYIKIDATITCVEQLPKGPGLAYFVKAEK